MNKIKKTFLKEKENDYKLRNPKIFSKYVIVLSKNNPNIKFTFIDIVFFLVVIFYIQRFSKYGNFTAAFLYRIMAKYQKL